MDDDIMDDDINQEELDKLLDYRTPPPTINSQATDDNTGAESNEDYTEQHDAGFSGWSEQQLNDFKVLKKFLSDALIVVDETERCGYSDKPYPKMPRITLEDITGTSRGKKRLSISNKQKCKKTKIDWKNMSAIDFNGYLKTLLLQPSDVNREKIIQQPAVMPTDNVDEMGEFLKQSYNNMIDQETVLMSKQLQLGKDLLVARVRFSQFKIESKSKTTWIQWLDSRTSISDSYAGQLKGLAELVGQFPKLQDLQISYTHMREMIPKIKSVFHSNQKIASEWMERN